MGGVPRHFPILICLFAGFFLFGYTFSKKGSASMEAISVIISICSLSLSIFLAIRTYAKELESYSMTVIDYRGFQTENQFLFCFSNTSSCPLTIISMSYDGLTCLLEPRAIETKRDGTVVRASAQFPLCIPAHGAQYAYVLFPNTEVPHKQLSPGTAVIFQIQTTRSLSQRSVTLSHTGYYLHKENYQ